MKRAVSFILFSIIGSYVFGQSVNDFSISLQETGSSEDYLDDVGKTNGKAEFCMGLLNYFAKKDTDAAVYWFQKSAEQGNELASGFLKSIGR
jgi:hypothetical protein